MSFASATSAWDGGLSNSATCNLRARGAISHAPPTTCSTGRTSSRGAERGLLLFLLDGLAVIFVMSFASTYVPLYALAMGATAAEIGLLSAAASLGVIGGSALSGRLVRLLGSPKRVVVYCARIWEAASYLPLLAIPFFFTGTTAVRVLIVVYAVRTLIGEAGVPAWAAFVPGLVPIHIRGRFMSLRSVLKMVAMMIIIPLAGVAITALGGYPIGYQVVFGIMMVLGLASAWFFSRIPEHGSTHEAIASREAQSGVRWRGAFGAFALGMTVWTLGTATVAPFYVVFMTRDLGLDARGIGLLTAVSTGAQLVGFLLLGPRVDRRGNRGTLIGSVLVLALVPFGWLLVREWTQILPLYVLAGTGVGRDDDRQPEHAAGAEPRGEPRRVCRRVLLHVGGRGDDRAADRWLALCPLGLFRRGARRRPGRAGRRSDPGDLAGAQPLRIPRRSLLERRGRPALGIRFRTT